MIPGSRQGISLGSRTDARRAPPHALLSAVPVPAAHSCISVLTFLELRKTILLISIDDIPPELPLTSDPGSLCINTPAPLTFGWHR